MSYTFDKYDADATSTADYPNVGRNLVYPALGAAGEAGELAEKVKKLWRNFGLMSPHSSGILTEAQEIDRDALVEGIVKESGDVLWYLSAIARELGVSLEYIALMNISKLRDRLDRGVVKSSGDNR